MNKGRILITGIGGMTGRCLAEYAVKKNYQVAGIINKTFPDQLKKLQERGLVKIYSADLTKPNKIKKIILDFKPTAIIHLAGRVLSRLDKRTSDPEIFVQNTKILKNLLAAIKRLDYSPRFILASGCLVYDKLSSPNFISEISIQNLPKASKVKEPYRASRIAQEKIVSKENIDYIIIRPTQVTGNGKIPGVVEYYIAKEISEVAKNKNKKVINIGNKLAEVDLVDVRDAAQAYLLLLEKGASKNIYHLSTGFPVTIEKLIKEFLRIVDFKPDEFTISSIITDPTYFRFSPKKLKQLGWKPKYNLGQTLINYFKYFKTQD